jgi:hypothetical protein
MVGQGKSERCLALEYDAEREEEKSFFEIQRGGKFV